MNGISNKKNSTVKLSETVNKKNKRKCYISGFFVHPDELRFRQSNPRRTSLSKSLIQVLTFEFHAALIFFPLFFRQGEHFLFLSPSSKIIIKAVKQIKTAPQIEKTLGGSGSLWDWRVNENTICNVRIIAIWTVDPFLTAAEIERINKCNEFNAQGTQKNTVRARKDRPLE